MFRALICPSSGVCDYVVELPHWPFRSCNTTISCASAGSLGTTPDEPHPNSSTQQIKNETANVVVQQHSRELLPEDGRINARNMLSL